MVPGVRIIAITPCIAPRRDEDMSLENCSSISFPASRMTRESELSACPVTCSTLADTFILIYFLNVQQSIHLLKVADQMPDVTFVYFTTLSINIASGHPNVHIVPPSRDGMLWCLHRCAVVWTTGGFMLPSEAVALGRPILITPTISHIEQEMNTRYFVRMFPSLVRACKFDTEEQMLLRDMLGYGPTSSQD